MAPLALLRHYHQFLALVVPALPFGNGNVVRMIGGWVGLSLMTWETSFAFVIHVYLIRIVFAQLAKNPKTPVAVSSIDRERNFAVLTHSAGVVCGTDTWGTCRGRCWSVSLFIIVFASVLIQRGYQPLRTRTRKLVHDPIFSSWVSVPLPVSRVSS